LRSNNSLITTPHKTSIPPYRNTRNNDSDHQEREKEATNNEQIWQSSNNCVSMAQMRQAPRYREEGQTPPTVASIPEPTPNHITQPSILTKSDLT
jgi:hypothetical protein